MDRFWFEDITKLFTETNYNKFVPDKNMSFVSKLNAIVRFSIYLAILIFVIKGNPIVFMIPIITLVFTYILWSMDKDKKTKEHLFLDEYRLSKKKNGKICQRPTQNNPFMNVLMTDYKNNPNRVSACDITESAVKKDIDVFFNKNLYRSVSDIFGKEASDRQYITNPSTTIPNDQEAFSKWLYTSPKTCKEADGLQCWKRTYNRL